ncbi:MAG: HlyD family type I secretion periplasmic adaptor subunit [Rhodospirillaceae bacterium]
MTLFVNAESSSDGAEIAVKLPVQLGIRTKRLLAEPVAFEEQNLSVSIRALLLLATLLIVAFIAWAWVTPIDEVANAPGQVIPTGAVKVVQHLEGGIVGSILAKEGQLVSVGEVLIRMETAVARSELDQVIVRSAELSLRIERLKAVFENREPEFGGLEIEWPSLAAAQRRIASNQRESYRTALTVIDSQIAARQEEMTQLKGTLDIAKRQLAITQKQVTIRRLGMNAGVVSHEVYLETARAEVASMGEVGRLTDQLRVTANTLAEQERRRSNQEASQRHDVLTELAVTNDELEQSKKTIEKQKDRVTRLDVRAPVDGLVQDIKVYAPGEVVAPGAVLMRVVPVHDQLQVEARISSTDVGRIHPGQSVRLKLSSYDYTRYGALPGVLRQISSSTFLDEQGRPYYKAYIFPNRAYMGRTPGEYPILPGMVVQADINTGKKTLATYLLKPLASALQESFHEH